MTFERTVANALTDATGVRWSRTKPGDVQELGDIIPQGPLSTAWGQVFVECKAHQSVGTRHLLEPNQQLKDWWVRCVVEALAVSRMPILMVRIKNFGIVMIAEWETLELLGYSYPSGSWEICLPQEMWQSDHVVMAVALDTIIEPCQAIETAAAALSLAPRETTPHHGDLSVRPA